MSAPPKPTSSSTTAYVNPELSAMVAHHTKIPQTYTCTIPQGRQRVFRPIAPNFIPQGVGLPPRSKRPASQPNPPRYSREIPRN